MNHEPNPPIDSLEERVITDLLAELAPEHETAGAGGEEAALRRELIDTLGLLPWALEPRTPSPSVRKRILDRVGGASVAPFAPPSARRPSSSSPRTRWLLPLAAGLTAALLGLAGWQVRQIEGQRETIARLGAQVDSGEQARGELARLRGQLDQRGVQLAMMTEPGAEYCVLRPSGPEPMYPEAHATMVVAADRGSWYMRVDGLGPCPMGRSYKVWFLTERGAVSGPAFRPDEADQEIEILRQSVPEGVRGIAITLEFDTEQDSPEGPQVLYADRAMTLL